MFGKGSYQTSSKSLNNPQIFGKKSYQTSPENLNPRITEENFQTPLVYSTPPIAKREVSKPRYAIRRILFKRVKRKELLKSIKEI